jgi:hypothetical protein
MLTRDDFITCAQCALDQIEEPLAVRRPSEWFLEFSRNLRQVLHEHSPGLTDVDEDDLSDAFDGEQSDEDPSWWLA